MRASVFRIKHPARKRTRLRRPDEPDGRPHDAIGRWREKLPSERTAVMYVLTVKSDNLDPLEVALVRMWRIIEAAGLASPATRLLNPAAGDWRLSVSFQRKQDRDHVAAELRRHARSSGYEVL